MNKKILFVLALLIGIVAIIVILFFFSQVNSIAEYVALFTSVSTATYAILAEPKERTEPILRVTPLLKSGKVISIGGSTMGGGLSLDVCIENIGYSIAKDIEVKCQITPDTSIRLKNNGVFKHSLLAPREIVHYEALEWIGKDNFLSQQLIIEASYSNEDDKRQKPIKKKCPVKELEEGLREAKTS